MLLQLPTSLVGAITQHTTVRFGLWLGTGVRKQLTIESPLRRNEHCTKGNAISTSECFTLYSVQLVAELNSKPYYGPGCATLQNWNLPRYTRTVFDRCGLENVSWELHSGGKSFHNDRKRKADCLCEHSDVLETVFHPGTFYINSRPDRATWFWASIDKIHPIFIFLIIGLRRLDSFDFFTLAEYSLYKKKISTLNCRWRKGDLTSLGNARKSGTTRSWSCRGVSSCSLP